MNNFETTLDIIDEIDIDLEERLRPALRESLNNKMGLSAYEDYENETATFGIYNSTKRLLCELRAKVLYDLERCKKYNSDKERLLPEGK